MDEFRLDADVDLMLKFQQGETSAFEELLDKYQGPIINFIYRFIPERAEAEDLAQEVFLRVYRCRQNYRPSAKFSTWIYRIAKNLALNEIRRRKSHKTSSLEENQGQIPDRDNSSAPAELERQDLIDTIKKAIDSLPPNQKTAVILRRYEDLSYEEISKIIGCSVKAVKSLLSRAKESLKEKLCETLSMD